jgi:hypothetical protein
VCSQQRRKLPRQGHTKLVRVCDSCAVAVDADESGDVIPTSSVHRSQHAARRVVRSRSLSVVAATALAAAATADATSDKERLRLKRLKLLRCRSWWISDVTAVYCRRYLLRPTALEVRTTH